MSDPIAIAEVLEGAARLIEPKGAWTTGAAARAENDEIVLPYSPRAVCWCLEGAVAAIVRKRWDSKAFERHPAYLALKRCGFLWWWNDVSGRTQAEVVGALRQAASRLREGGL